MNRFSYSLAFVLVITTSLSVHGADVPATQWKARMERALPSMLCAKESPVRDCLSVTDDQCVKGLTKTTRACLARIGKDIPERVSVPKQGEELGSRVGDCAEDLFVIENSSLLKNIPQCAEYKQVILKSQWKSK